MLRTQKTSILTFYSNDNVEKAKPVTSIQEVTKRCLLSWLTNSALVYEPKCEGGGGGGLRARSQMSTAVPEFIDLRFRENKPKMLVFSHRKRAFWACFRENCVYNFGHGAVVHTDPK